MSKLYTIEQIIKQDQQLLAKVNIDASHAVFEGHFPEKSVLPGVVELEMIRQIVSQHFESAYRISTIKSAKYTAMFLPDEHTFIEAQIDIKELYQALKVKAVLKTDNQVLLKFSGELALDE